MITRCCLSLALVTMAANALAAVSGRVIASQGTPVADAAVSAFPQETAEARVQRFVAGQDRRALAIAKSGADGSFLLDVDEAVVDIGVQAPGFAPALTAVARAESVTLTLKAAPARRGAVMALGKPVADATVVWTVQHTDPQSPELIVRTAKDGSYEVPDPEVWASNLAIVSRDYALFLDVPHPKWGKTLRHELTAGALIQGQVVDEGSGRGLPGAAVWVDGWPRAKSAPDGTFTIPHAASDWKRIVAKTDARVGTFAAGPPRVVVVAKPAHRLYGWVRDAHTKQPIAGALVLSTDNDRDLPASAITDLRGEYRLSGLTSGRYWASAIRAGYTAVAPAASSSEQVDLRRSLAARRDLDLAPMRRVSGRVQDEQGRPIEGARMSLGWWGMGTLYGNLEGVARPFMEMPSSMGPASVTGADGRFTVVVPESLRKESAAAGLQPDLVALKPGYAAGHAKLELASGSGPVVVMLPRGVTTRGRVTGPDGAPLGGVAVFVAESGPFFSMRSLASQTDPDTEAWTTTDAAGRFTLQLQSGPHELSFHKHGVAPKSIEGFDPRGGQDFEVVLETAVEIRGRVVRADGRGVGEARLTLQDRSTLAATAVSEPDGSFSIGDLAAGTYELTIDKEDSGIHATRRVEAPVPDLQVVLGPTITLRGRVFDAATRAPVPQFTLMLEPAAPSDGNDSSVGRSQDFKVALGTFVMEDVPLGGSNLVVQAEGYLAKTIEGVFGSADADNPALEVALEAGVAIRGRVTGPDGEPVADAQVFTANRGGRGEGQGAATDENGDYELKAVIPGEITVQAAKEGFRSARHTVQANQSTRADLTLPRGLSISGIVVYGEAGVAEARVMASSSAPDADSQSAITDARGRFTLQGLAPGRYEVTASADDKGRAEAHDVEATNPGALRLVIEHVPTAILAGTVVGLGDGSNPPPVVMVQVQDATGHSALGIAQVSGDFRVEEAPAGTVTVSARAMGREGNTRTSENIDLTLAPGSENTTVIAFRDDVAVSGTVIRGGEGVRDVNVSFMGGREVAAASTSDRDGHYQVQLAPGPYSVSVTGGNVSYETRYTAVASGSFDIDLTGGVLRGRATEAGTTAPISGVDVSVWPAQGGESHPVTSLRTNDQGIFEAPFPEGRYRLVTARKDFGQQEREVELQRDATADVLFELHPADGVRVKVADARDGRALEAIVVVRDGTRRIVANQHAGIDADGAVIIPLADGPYLLSTSATGYGTATLPITAPAKGLAVGLTPGGTLVVESARKLRGRIRLMQPDGEEYVRCWCNGIADIQLEGRRTVVDHVTPGSYSLELVEVPETLPPRRVVIQEGQVATVTIP